MNRIFVFASLLYAVPAFAQQPYQPAADTMLHKAQECENMAYSNAVQWKTEKETMIAQAKTEKDGMTKLIADLTKERDDLKKKTEVPADSH